MKAAWHAITERQRLIDWLHSVVRIGVLLHLAGYFGITNQTLHTNLFYGLVGLPVLVLVILQRGVQFSLAHKLMPAFVLLLTLALSVTWSASPLFAWVDVLKHSLILSTLFLALAMRAEQWRARSILDGYAILGSVYATAMLMVYFFPETFGHAALQLGIEGYLGSGLVGWHSWYPRITHGGNFLINPVFAAMFCGGALLYAGYVFLTTPERGRAIMAVFSLGPLVVFFLLLQSRGPLLALSLTLLMLPFVSLPRIHRLLVLFVLVAGGITAIYFATDIFSRVFERGEMRFLMSGVSLGARGDIYQQCIGEGTVNPVAGIGLIPGLIVDVPENPHVHCHSVPIDIFRFAGLLGLGAFFWLSTAALGRCFRIRGLGSLGLVSSYFLLALMFDGSQPLERPGPLWAMFWIPLVLALVIPAASDKSVDQQPFKHDRNHRY